MQVQAGIPFIAVTLVDHETTLLLTASGLHYNSFCLLLSTCLALSCALHCTGMFDVPRSSTHVQSNMRVGVARASRGTDVARGARGCIAVDRCIAVKGGRLSCKRRRVSYSVTSAQTILSWSLLTVHDSSSRHQQVTTVNLRLTFLTCGLCTKRQRPLNSISCLL